VDGDFRLESWLVQPSLNSVSRNDTSIQIEPKLMSVLVCLAEHAPDPVAKEMILQKVWPDTFVGEGVLTRSISELRRILEDEAKESRLIQTIAKRGYRLVAPIRPLNGKIQRQNPRFRSLAVLPLENLSHDPEQEYLAEGLTEALITTLAKIGDLRVVSRTSSMLYRGVREPVREIARKLQVDAIVEGSVLRAGDRLRITAQLIDPISESHLWAESYDRYLRDVLDLQSEVTQAIAGQIRIRLTPMERANLASAHSVDPDAYEAYLKGRYYWNRRSGDALPKGVQFFQQAIAKDPTYAAAYSGLADCLSALGIYSFVSPEEGCGKAKELAVQALEIDPSLADAHVSLAWAMHWHDYDFSTVEREFTRALELSPRYFTAHQWFGLFLAQMGRYEEGYTEGLRAVRLEPCSSAAYWALGLVYWCSRRYDQAIEQFEKTFEFDPSFVQGYFGLGMVYPYKSMHQEAIAAAQKGVELTHGAAFFLTCLGEAYAVAGHSDEARRTLGELNNPNKYRYVTPYFVARIHAALDEKEKALSYLETGYRHRDPQMTWLKTDPRLDPLRPDPRFQSLMRRMNFPL